MVNFSSIEAGVLHEWDQGEQLMLRDEIEHMEGRAVTSWADLRKNYVTFMIAKALEDLDRPICPFPEVATVWRAHLLNTCEYRKFETLVLRKSGSTRSHLDHSTRVIHAAAQRARRQNFLDMVDASNTGRQSTEPQSATLAIQNQRNRSRSPLARREGTGTVMAEDDESAQPAGTTDDVPRGDLDSRSRPRPETPLTHFNIFLTAENFSYPGGRRTCVIQVHNWWTVSDVKHKLMLLKSESLPPSLHQFGLRKGYNRVLDEDRPLGKRERNDELQARDASSRTLAECGIEEMDTLYVFIRFSRLPPRSTRSSTLESVCKPASK
ncbi:unnamed protein product [Amoebophrya sp. A120]|nr:unnamed protein product [Amoebophrya sp. A120]|eukprot:GSA120T00004816001.1